MNSYFADMLEEIERENRLLQEIKEKIAKIDADFSAVITNEPGNTEKLKELLMEKHRLLYEQLRFIRF